MKSKFLPGLLTGITVALLIAAISLVPFISGIRENTGGNSEQVAAAQKQYKTEDKIALLKAYINKYYLNPVDDQKITEGLYKGIMDSLDDPYAAYYTENEFKQVMDSSNGIYCGIGASVSQDATGIITIVKPFKDGPAAKSGVLPGDILYKVDDKEVTGVDLTQVVTQMKGKEGTSVTVEVVREGVTDPIAIKIVRAEVKNPTIESEMLAGQIGYILVTEFDGQTDEQYRKALDQLEKDGMKGLIIDLRNNPGGNLETVVDMLDRMLPEGMIVYQEDKDGNRFDERKSTAKESFKKPCVVMMNSHSASASEVFAGAMQDYKLADVVGTVSFGKGIVQTILPLGDGSAMKMTTAKYFTPKGRNIHKVGITPDVKVELNEDLKKKVVVTKEEDNQLQKAMEVIQNKVK